jgi:hypothetical protein
MRVDETRHNRRVAEIDVGAARAVRLDGDDTLAVDGDRAALQRRPARGEDPAGGQRPGG